MSRKFAKMILTLIPTLFAFSFSLYSQEQDQEQVSRFSHKGLKAALGSSAVEIIHERGLDEGEGGSLSLGYGFTDRFSLWLTLFGSEHPRLNGSEQKTEFGGIELNLQQKFEIESRFQPYGKVGFGVYALHEESSDVSLIGAGLNIALGVDLFFSKHFGVGAELMFKKLDYYSERRETVQGTLVTDLNPDLNGDAVAFMLTLTVQ